jgi:hypothetical protein
MILKQVEQPHLFEVDLSKVKCWGVRKRLQLKHVGIYNIYIYIYIYISLHLQTSSCVLKAVCVCVCVCVCLYVQNFHIQLYI